MQWPKSAAWIDLEQEQILPLGMSPKEISLSAEKTLPSGKPSHVSDVEF